MNISIRISVLSILKPNIIKRFSSKHTIYALSSGYGKCGVAVVRVSGPQTANLLKKLIKSKSPPPPRTALLRKIYNPINNDVLDRGLVLWFPAPNSFTGEDCCEFQVHGSIAVVSAVMQSLNTFPRVRLAEPGEFTRRAFHNGKLDLTAVEGLSDLLQAETELQRKQAYLQTEGALSDLYKIWREKLIKCLSNMEAFIDFEETETIDNDIMDDVKSKVKTLIKDIEIHVADKHRGEILRNGVKTVIIGEPNVGKSSLLNNLCNKQRAIVSPVEGTTRDLLETTIDVNGYPMILTDTAGLRKNATDIVEREGISRAVDSMRSSDLILFVIDTNKYLNNNGFDWELLNDAKKSHELDGKEHLVICNKVDLIDDKMLNVLQENNLVLISCKTKYGFDNLYKELDKELTKICGDPTKEQPSITHQRHRNHLKNCLSHLQKFVDANTDVVLTTQHLHYAARELGKLTGSVKTEELLDVIFRDFCIGK